MTEPVSGWIRRISAATHSLRFKTTVGVTVLIVMIAALLSSLFVAYLQRSESDGARRLAEETTEVIAATVASGVRSRDLDESETLLDGFLSDSRVLYVILTTPSGSLVRSSEHCPAELAAYLEAPPEWKGALYQAHALPSPAPLDRHRLEVCVPVGGAGSSPAAGSGILRAGFSTLATSRRVEELRWRVAMITFAIIVLGTFGTMFLTGRIVGPIQELARGTHRLAEGDFDFRAPVETHDEVGVLARSFNRMTERLREAMEAQRQFTSDQRRLVEVKTREIEETREHLSNIVENVGASILVADLDGTVISANTHTMRIFGTKPEFTVGRHLSEFSCEPEMDIVRLRYRLQRSGIPRVSEARFHLDDRHELDLLITHTLLRDGGGNPAGFLQITKDITELKRMERRLVSSERLSAMGEMAGEIGHELNNYLMAIGGRAELITTALAHGKDPRHLDKVERSARIIAEQVAEMRRLTDGLLDSARKETAPQEFDLNDLVRSTVDFVKPQNKFDALTLRVETPPGALQVVADPQQIRQVVLNLLSNGAESCRDRPEPGGELQVCTFREQDEVGFSVGDNGVGIDEPTRQRIFEPHFTTKPDGHGFGLAVCHRVVENHGGVIRVDSSPGQGATFTVRLPLRVAESASAGGPASP